MAVSNKQEGPMSVINKILCPTDFSDASYEAFSYAERVAQETGAEILLLHVFDVSDYYSSGGKPPSIDPEIERRLLEMKPAASAVKVTHMALAGAAGELVCWIGQEQKCDLVIIATHGRTGLAHLLMGSVTEYVVRHARSPVMTIRQGLDKAPPLPEPHIRHHMPPIL